MGDFDGKTILITGGGTGLGAAMAHRLASDGARCILAGRRAEPLAQTVAEIEARGGRAEAKPLDVRDPAAVDAAVADVIARHHRLDGLVNNAAGNFMCPTEELTPNGWKAVVDIVLNGTFYCSRAAGRAMIADGKGGAILNIVASYAWTGGPFTAHSASAKAGVVALTLTLASEWGRHGIRTNALSPGIVNTPGSAEKLFPTEAHRSALAQRVPLGRLGTEREIADAAAFLLSDRAAYINGAVLVADGGLWLGQGFLAAAAARDHQTR